MSINTSPSMASLLLNSPSMADSSETDATSRSSTSPDDVTISSDVEVDNNSKGFPWILYRILECQLSCELPLRIMFAFNSGQKLPTLKQAYQYWHYGNQGKFLIAFLSAQQKITPSLNDATLQDLQNPPSGPPESINPDHHPSDRFMDKGNEFLLDIDLLSIEQGRRKSDGLPHWFVKGLCLKSIFHEEYKECDFTQALTGLDYLRDIEVTRRVSLREAALRLGITKENWRDVLAEDPDAKQWMENMQALELDVALYYATIFVDLRIWTMINELHCKPFYKPNVLALLNTLFPPSVKELPNDKIDKTILYKYRAHFYHYTLEVEKRGPEVLKHWVEGLLKPGTKHSWPETRKNLVLYFERADNMIKSSTAIHGIEFFRARSSKYSETTLSLSGRQDIGNGDDTLDTDSQRGLQSQVSVATSAPKSPTGTLNSHKAPQVRMKKTPRHRISTSADQKAIFEPPQSPWASLEAFHHSNDSTQSLRSRTAAMTNTSRSGTPQIKTRSLRSRTRTQSRPATPPVDQGSEAAKHDSFTRPITPFEDIRRDIIARREAVTGPPKTAMELSIPPTPEMESYYHSKPTGHKTTLRSVTTPLPNDNFAFLKQPYEPPPPCPLPPIPTNPTLKKKSSFGSLFVSRKSPAPSNSSLRNKFDIDSQNALGIKMAPLIPVKSETFPQYPQDVPSEGHPLRKQISSSDLEKSESRTTLNTLHSSRSRAASGMAGSGLSGVAEDETLTRKLKKQRSLPSIINHKASTSGATREKFVVGGNNYERITVIDIPVEAPRPATSHGPSTKQELRKAKSFASIRSWAAIGTDTKKTVRLRKSSNFRCEPQEGETIRGKTISEPFPMNLQNKPSLLKPESQSKEWTRKWFVEQGRAKRFDLNPPEGGPIRNFERAEEKKGGLASWLRKEKKEEVEVVEKAFEFPRATPKIPDKPNKQRWNSIFPRREVVKKKPTTHTPIDIGKYVDYPGRPA